MDKKISSKKRLSLQITPQCNNQCLFCNQGCQDRKQKISLDQIKNIISEGARKGCQLLTITGGEPTLKPDVLISSVKYAKQQGYSGISLMTNGRMMAYQYLAQELIDAGVDQFGISIHGSKPEINDLLTQSPGSFDQTIQGLRNIKNANCNQVKISTNTVIVKQNLSDLKNIVDLLLNEKVDTILFSFVRITGSVNNPQAITKIVPRISEAPKYIKQAIQFGESKHKFYNFLIDGIPLCLINEYEKYLTDKKEPSTLMQEIGNSSTLADWEKYRETKGRIKEKKCEECQHFDICEGPWVEYPQIFGWDEFNPIVKKIIQKTWKD
jgi:MoaA/NifB/PqqE/SkfB family radical SAM enzyme